MHNSKPSIFRQIRACVYSHFSAWLHSPRTIVMGIVILCFAYMHARSYGYTLSMRGYTAHLGEMVFNYLDSGFNRRISHREVAGVIWNVWPKIQIINMKFR